MFSSIFLSHYAFFEGCPSCTKIDRRGERSTKNKQNMLLDWSRVQPGKMSLKSNLGFLRCFYNSQPYFWSTDRQTDAYTHKPFSCLANIQYKGPYFWVSPIPIISSSALSVLHPAASNQKPDLSASHVWLQHKWMSASFSTVCLGVPSGWNWDLNMLRRSPPPT